MMGESRRRKTGSRDVRIEGEKETGERKSRDVLAVVINTKADQVGCLKLGTPFTTSLSPLFRKKS